MIKYEEYIQYLLDRGYVETQTWLDFRVFRIPLVDKTTGERTGNYSKEYRRKVRKTYACEQYYDYWHHVYSKTSDGWRDGGNKVVFKDNKIVNGRIYPNNFDIETHQKQLQEKEEANRKAKELKEKELKLEQQLKEEAERLQKQKEQEELEALRREEALDEIFLLL
jgi:hypothetical protein